jgi:hypothetical protein
MWVLSRVLQKKNPCPLCVKVEEIEDLSVGSLGGVPSAGNSNLTPGQCVCTNRGEAALYGGLERSDGVSAGSSGKDG